MPIIEVEGHKDFLKRIIPNEYIIIFKASWCLPSKAMLKIIDDSASKNQGTTYYSCDIGAYDFDAELKKFNVFTIPTVVSVKGGKIHGTSIGTVSRLQFSIFSGLK